MEKDLEEIDKFIKENSRAFAEVLAKVLLRDPEFRKMIDEIEEKE